MDATTQHSPTIPPLSQSSRSAPDRRRAGPPTRGALRWLRDAADASGVRLDAASGPVSLGGQRHLARLTGVSAGTVNAHVRRLGVVVVETAPELIVDADVLASAAPCVRYPTRERVIRPPASEHQEPHDVPAPPAAVSDLADLISALLKPVVTGVVERLGGQIIAALADRVLGDDECATFVRDAARRSCATPRDVSENSNVARLSTRKEGDSIDSAFLPGGLPRDIANVARQTKRRAANQTSRGRLSRTEIDSLCAPLVEACNKVTPRLDDRRYGDFYEVVGQLTAEELRWAVSQLCREIRGSRTTMERPFGVLRGRVLAGEIAEPPNGTGPPPPLPVIDDDETTADPIDNITEEELAAARRSLGRAGASAPPALLEGVVREIRYRETVSTETGT